MINPYPERRAERAADTVSPPRRSGRRTVLRAGVCGTDRHLHVGEFGPTYPLTPGHESTGTVREVVQHALKALEREGAVALSRGRIAAAA